jgi:hypothetical protein
VDGVLIGSSSFSLSSPSLSAASSSSSVVLSHLADINVEERKEKEHEEITEHPSHVAMLVDESYLTGETCPVSIEE